MFVKTEAIFRPGNYYPNPKNIYDGLPTLERRFDEL